MDSGGRHAEVLGPEELRGMGEEVGEMARMVGGGGQGKRQSQGRSQGQSQGQESGWRTGTPHGTWRKARR